jgi:hypothetical protein
MFELQKLISEKSERMKQRIDWNKWMPYLVAILVFYVITLIYFAPMLEGKRLVQPDIKNHIGMSKEIMDHREKYGEEPYWSNSMFGGMPAYLVSATYVSDFLAHAGTLFCGFLPIPAGALFLYMIGFFILLIVLRVDSWLSLLGAVAFAFSSYFFVILEAGHNSKAIAIGFMAPVLAGVILLYRGKYLLGAGVTALFLALEIKATHPQITYYLGLLIAVYLLFKLAEAIREKQLMRFAKATGIFVGVAIIAALTHFTALSAINEWGKVSIRGASELSIGQDNKTSGLDRDYATQWSYGRGESWTLLVPNFKGGATGAIGEDPALVENIDPRMQQAVAGSNRYWGDQPFTSGPVYVGAIIFFLAVLGMFVLKGPLKWALFTATIFSLLLSWGKNLPGLTNFFMDFFPAYNKFRAVSMILVVAELCIPLLAILGLKAVIDKPALLREKLNLRVFKLNPLILSFVLSGGIALMFFVSPGNFNAFESANEEQTVRQQVAQQLQGSGGTPEQIAQTLNNYTFEYMNALRQARTSIFKRDAIRSFGFILVAALLLFLWMRGWLKQVWMLAGIGLFILIDMWVVNQRYLHKENFKPKRFMEVPFAPTAADQTILADPDLNFRVFNSTLSSFNDASTSYYHKSIGGYHGAKLRRYQEMIDYHLNANNYKLLDMLNMKYIIRDGGNGVQAIVNPGAMGNAWFVDRIKWVNNPDEEYIYVGDAAVVKTAPGALMSVTGVPITVDTVSMNKPLQLSVPAMPDSVFLLRLADYRMMDSVVYRFGVNETDTTPGFTPIRDPKAIGRVLPNHFTAEVVYRFDPITTAVIDQRWKEVINIGRIQRDTNAMIRLLTYKPNHLVYAARCATPQLAVFSEIFYEKGWNAYLNDELVPHGRANWLLRTMVVPAGEHKIEFKFEPDIIRKGEPISIAASVLVILLFFAALWFSWKQKQKQA